MKSFSGICGRIFADLRRMVIEYSVLCFLSSDWRWRRIKILDFWGLHTQWDTSAAHAKRASLNMTASAMFFSALFNCLLYCVAYMRSCEKLLTFCKIFVKINTLYISHLKRI